MDRKRPVGASEQPVAKRQASLAAFFKPKTESSEPTVSESTVAKKNDVEPYPPYDHPAYRPPPHSRYNHPFPIPSPTFSLSFNTSPRAITGPPDLDLLYLSRFIDPSCSTQLMRYLLESLPWYRVRYTVRGISINTPRWTTVWGKDSSANPWDGYKCKPRAIPEVLLTIMKKVEEITNEHYNFALVNYYASGSDSISYHSDSEHFLGPLPCIASLSLGAPRDFFLRHTKHKDLGVPVEKFVLHDGDMVVMRGLTQSKWEHSIPKRASAEGRINITFRKAIVKYGTENYNQYNVGQGPMYRWDKAKGMVEQ